MALLSQFNDFMATFTLQALVLNSDLLLRSDFLSLAVHIIF